MTNKVFEIKRMGRWPSASRAMCDAETAPGSVTGVGPLCQGCPHWGEPMTACLCPSDLRMVPSGWEAAAPAPPGGTPACPCVPRSPPGTGTPLRLALLRRPRSAREGAGGTGPLQVCVDRSLSLGPDPYCSPGSGRELPGAGLLPSTTMQLRLPALPGPETADPRRGCAAMSESRLLSVR